MAAKSQDWDQTLPVALITGGVHGFETSGVFGALEFLSDCQEEYAGKLNLLVVPCVSPWAYERVARWNYNAVAPDRQFFAQGSAEESTSLMQLVSGIKGRFLIHVDLHETTDTDESEFSPALAARDGQLYEPESIPDGFYLSGIKGRFLIHVDLHETTDTDESEFSPALAARDGQLYEPESIPDGFYLVSDRQNSRLDFQRAIIEAVEKVTHIAPADHEGSILGFPVVSPGVIEYDNGAYHLCATITGAPFTTTTEVSPDSAETSLEECVRAQVVTIRQAIDFALSN